MTRQFPLKSLLDLSQLRLDEATRRLGELIAGEQQAEERLVLLIQYRDEYHAQFLAVARDGIGRTAWNNYQNFLARLDDAIAEARKMAETTRQRTAAGKDEWIGKRGRVKAFDTLAKRHIERIVRTELKQEQKMQDEHASRLAGKKSGE